MTIYVNSKISNKIFGNNDQLIVLGWDGYSKQGKGKLYTVHCNVCSLDPELHGEANYLMQTSHINSGIHPCGCSEKPKWTKKQYETIIKRRGTSNGYKFIEWKNTFNNQSSRVILSCDKHSAWESAVGEIISDRTSCKVCANLSTPSVKEFIVRSTLIHQNKYNYDSVLYRITTDKIKIFCNNCKINFNQSVHNHMNGTGCPSCAQHNFDPNKDGFIYLCKVTHKFTTHSFAGYGKTNNPPQRLLQHKNAASKEEYEITDFVYFESKSGNDASLIEKELKKYKPLKGITIKGFKRENTSIENYEEIKSLLVKCITLK